MKFNSHIVKMSVSFSQIYQVHLVYSGTQYNAGVSNPVPGELPSRMFSLQPQFSTPDSTHQLNDELNEATLFAVEVKTYRMVALQDWR